MTVTVAFPEASATAVPIALPAELLNVTVAPGEAVTAICWFFIPAFPVKSVVIVASFGLTVTTTLISLVALCPAPSSPVFTTTVFVNFPI